MKNLKKLLLLAALTLSAGFKGGEVVPSFYIGATFGCAFGTLLGLPAGFSAAVGLADYLSDEVTDQPGQSMGAYWEQTRG